LSTPDAGRTSAVRLAEQGLPTDPLRLSEYRDWRRRNRQSGPESRLLFKHRASRHRQRAAKPSRRAVARHVADWPSSRFPRLPISGVSVQLRQTRCGPDNQLLPFQSPRSASAPFGAMPSPPAGVLCRPGNATTASPAVVARPFEGLPQARPGHACAR
jgi:hypothetical protein